MKKSNIVILVLAVIIPLLIGVISAYMSRSGMELYATMDKPPLSPPAWVFSVAWTILYIMMGVASYFILVSDTKTSGRAIALSLYAIQLLMNCMWSIIFFNWNAYFAAFVWLIIMWGVVIACAIRFYSINRIATYLFIPYILWLTFAAYLNLGAYLKNI